MKFTLNILPAKYGDCIWIEYGKEKTYRILIDGGTSGTKKAIKQIIRQLPEVDRNLDLVVVTHVDRDHIEGILSLLEEPELDFQVNDFWFNGWSHLPGNASDETFGAVQGERLTANILRHQLPWNKAFDGAAVMLPDTGILPIKELPGGMKVTLLSPTVSELSALKPQWVAELLKAGLQPGIGAVEAIDEDNGIEKFGTTTPNVEKLNNATFKQDTSKANGSSIAFLLEYEGKTVLFAGDAYPDLVLESLTKLYPGKAPLHLIKLSHHGSSHNTSPALIEKLDCSQYLISTNGAIYHHPSQETIAWIIKRSKQKPKIIFNYRTDENTVWDDPLLKSLYRYSTAYPEKEGIRIELF